MRFSSSLSTGEFNTTWANSYVSNCLFLYTTLFGWIQDVCKWKGAKIEQGKNKSVYSICNICESLQIYGASRNRREYCSLGNNPPPSQMCSSPDQVLELKIIVFLFWKIYEINEESISQNWENCNNKKNENCYR